MSETQRVVWMSDPVLGPRYHIERETSHGWERIGGGPYYKKEAAIMVADYQAAQTLDTHRVIEITEEVPE